MGPYGNVSDTDLIERAKQLMTEAFEAAPSSRERHAKMGAYNAIVNELKLRLLQHVSRKLELPDCEFSPEALAELRISF